MAELQGNEALKRLRELVKDIDICMMTTVTNDGLFHSRPMSANGDINEDGTLWLFSRERTFKIDELHSTPSLHLAFSDTSKNLYVSISGTAEIITDKEAFKAHWKPALKAWFPKGVEEEDLALIKVTLQVGEYWETTGNFISHTLSFMKALTTGTEVKNLGDHGVVNGARLDT